MYNRGNTLNNYIEEYINNAIKEKYQIDRNNINKSNEALECILKEYKKNYPLRFIRNYYFKKFYKSVIEMKLIPEYKEYEDISKKDELFDINIILPVKIKENPYGIAFSIIVDISKLSRYIQSKKSKRVAFYTEELSKMVTESYWIDYKKDNEMRLEKRDILVDEKAKNPIIVLAESQISKCTIINGNHRIMYLSKNNINQLEGYYVTVDEACQCGITKDYEILYNKVLGLLNRLK